MAESATSVGSLAYFGLFAMFSPTPLRLRARPFLQKPQAQGRIHNPPRTASVPAGSQSAYIRRTSYWLSDANEMAAIKTSLIIVNSAVR
jgi:hypothetical protein